MPEAKVINVSNQSPNRRIQDQHIDSLPLEQRIAIEAKLQACGVDTERMRETYLSRWCYCIYAYDQLGRNHFRDDPIFKLDQQGLF